MGTLDCSRGIRPLQLFYNSILWFLRALLQQLHTRLIPGWDYLNHFPDRMSSSPRVKLYFFFIVCLSSNIFALLWTGLTISHTNWNSHNPSRYECFNDIFNLVVKSLLPRALRPDQNNSGWPQVQVCHLIKFFFFFCYSSPPFSVQ